MKVSENEAICEDPSPSSSENKGEKWKISLDNNENKDEMWKLYIKLRRQGQNHFYCFISKVLEKIYKSL